MVKDFFWLMLLFISIFAFEMMEITMICDLKNTCLKIVLLMQGLLLWWSSACAGDGIVRVGMAWQRQAYNYDRVARSIIAAGGVPVILEQTRPAGFDYDGENLSPVYLDENGILLQQYATIVKKLTYHGSNIEQVMDGIDAVVFLGGGDFSPTLMRVPQPWHGIEAERNYDITRDLSEYLTMAYCLDNDIPVLGLCRGMQLLGIVSGAPLIQDLKTHFDMLGKDEGSVHRSSRDEQGNRHYTPHDVRIVDTNSLLWEIVRDSVITGVPSWHHQAVENVDDTRLKVTAITVTDGVNVIEAIERTDKAFALGVQFHPEEAIRKHLDEDNDAKSFMQLYQGVNYFKALVNAALEHRKKSSLTHSKQ